jgi:hypothetical protein
VIKWNTALQLQMGDPAWVDLMWDASAKTLGIRAINSATGIPIVKEPEGSEYYLDSYDALDAAGVPVDITVGGAPDSWIQSTSLGPGTSVWFGYLTIYYITLP